MLVLSAPNFQPSGDFLTAFYNLDFTKDLSLSIPCEGTWQGDRKKALSFYVDNYNSTFAVSVNNGGSTVKVPAYTAANINISSLSDVVITSEGISQISGYLSTEPKNTSAAPSRGNAPSATNGALSYTGSLQVGQSNAPQWATYVSDIDTLFVSTTNANFIAIDPKTKLVTNVYSNSDSFSISKMVRGPGNWLFFMSGGNQQIRAFNFVTGEVKAVVDYPPGSPFKANQLAFDSINNRLYTVTSDNAIRYATVTANADKIAAWFIITLNGGSIPGNPACVTFCPDDGNVYVGCIQAGTTQSTDVIRVKTNGSTEYVYVNSGITAGVGTAYIEYITDIKKLVCCAGLVGTAANSDSYRIKLLDIANFSVNSTKSLGKANASLSGVGYCKETKYLYFNTGDVADVTLASLVASMPNYPQSTPAPVYCNSIAQLAFPRSDFTVYFGR
jgi:hypothetical protein